MNELMEQAYVRKCQAVARDFPVVLHLEDKSLVLHDRHTRLPAVNPARPVYDLLKQLSHLPLALQLVASPDVLRQLIPEIRAEVEASALEAEELAVQRKILDVCASFLERADDIRELGLSLRQELRFNLRRAAERRVRGMHEQLMEWSRELRPDRWRELRVLIVTSRMARRENLPEQYFRWLLGGWLPKPLLSRRIFQVEGIQEEAEALRMLGVFEVDSEIGECFFGKAETMHRDLLSLDAERILREETFAPQSAIPEP
jgi:hypothetical protein